MGGDIFLLCLTSNFNFLWKAENVYLAFIVVRNKELNISVLVDVSKSNAIEKEKNKGLNYGKFYF